MTTASPRRTGRRLPKTITSDEFDRLLDEIPPRSATGLRNRAILRVMWDTGLRVSEVCSLAPGDVTHDRSHRRCGFLHVRHGKGNVDRTLPLPPRTMDAIDAWRDKRGVGGPYLFCTISGRRRLAERDVRAMLARTSERAGVFKLDCDNRERPINPHQLRHSYATRTLRAPGMTIADLQRLLGHAHLSTTSVYLAVDDADLARRCHAAFDDEDAADDGRMLVRGAVHEELRDHMTPELMAQLVKLVAAEVRAQEQEDDDDD